MGTLEKMIERIMRTPTATDIQPKELQNFLERYGFILQRVKGSHYIYKYPKNVMDGMVLNIPMHKPVHPAYIDLVRSFIEKIEESKE